MILPLSSRIALVTGASRGLFGRNGLTAVHA